MSFKITLVPPIPSEAVLCAEKPINGLEFISIAESCLRRVVGCCEPQTHNTLGRLTNYPIQLTEEMAIASGLFETTNEVYVIVPNDALKKFLFYTAEKRSSTAGTTVSRVYPYYKTGTILHSHVDEFAFLETWQKYGYPTSLVGLIDGAESAGNGGSDNTDTSTPNKNPCGCGPFCNMNH